MSRLIGPLPRWASTIGLCGRAEPGRGAAKHALLEATDRDATGPGGTSGIARPGIDPRATTSTRTRQGLIRTTKRPAANAGSSIRQPTSPIPRHRRYFGGGCRHAAGAGRRQPSRCSPMFDGGGFPRNGPVGVGAGWGCCSGSTKLSRRLGMLSFAQWYELVIPNTRRAGAAGRRRASQPTSCTRTPLERLAACGFDTYAMEPPARHARHSGGEGYPLPGLAHLRVPKGAVRLLGVPEQLGWRSWLPGNATFNQTPLLI